MNDCHLGMGVMINMLFDNRSEEEQDVLADVRGSVIKSVILDNEPNHGDGALIFTFEDGTKLTIMDQGRSCCEDRYIRCDDDLTYYAGAVLEDIKIECGGTTEGKWGDCHEIQFLLVHTSKGVFTANTHNEHNGYYGGFYMVAEIEQPTKEN